MSPKGGGMEEIMKRIIAVICLCFVMILMSSCSYTLDQTKGDGEIVTKELAAENFSSIVYSGVGDVNISFLDSYSVNVTTNSNIQELIKADVKDEVLTISFTKSTVPIKELTIDITMPEIKAIEMSGTGNITLNDGNTSDLEINYTGVGDIDAQKYQVNNVVINHSGVGEVKLWATDLLRGELTGVGDLLYKGKPTLKIDNTGTGSVEPL